MQGLTTICHEAPKGGYNGSRWPNHKRASALLDPEPPPDFSVIALLLREWHIEHRA